MRRDLRVTELDFDKIKTNFKNFMKSQDLYTEYDFDASGFDVLFDVLAYNTHYNAVYVNTAINESFIGSAVERANIVKGARGLAYVPKSVYAARAEVNLKVDIPEDTLITVFGSADYGYIQMNAYNTFTTKIDNSTFSFVNPEAINLRKDSSGSFSAIGVTILQGNYTSFRYTVDLQDAFQKFVIPSDKVDLSTLDISSVAPGEAEVRRYVYYKDVNLQDIDGNTPIYLIFENSDGEYEIQFGDGAYGYAPVNNEQITMTYVVSDGAAANGAKLFNASNRITLSGNYSVSDVTVQVDTTTRATGGAPKESTESVQYNAPLYFQTQDRAVIVNDYATLVRSQFSNVEAVNAWGGEDNVPPQYGRVFIVAKPYGALFFKEVEKEAILNGIKEKMVGAIRPTIVDPKYTDVSIEATVKYDSKKTLKPPSEIKSRTISRLVKFSADNLEKFQNKLYMSQVIDLVQEIDRSSIESVSFRTKLKKEFLPVLNITNSYTFYFQNPILYPYTGYKGSIVSSTFTYNNIPDCTLEQNPKGKISIMATVNSVRTTIVDDIGTVDYANGIIVLKSFAPSAYTGNFMRLFVTPRDNDVTSKREFILRIREQDIVVNVIDEGSIGSLTDSLTANQGTQRATVDVSSNVY